MTTLTVQNLNCEGCAKTITSGIQGLEGVSKVLVNIALSTVSFESDSGKTIENVKKELALLGYPEAEVKKTIHLNKLSI